MFHLQNVISLALFSIFTFTCYSNWQKYNLGLTSFDVEEKRVKYMKYPSVTICPSLVFTKNKAKYKKVLKNSNSTLDDKIDIMNGNKNIDDTVFHLDHPSDDNEGHPCMTKFGPYDAGKPCIFPFRFQLLNSNNAVSSLNYSRNLKGILTNSCFEMFDGIRRVCPTKVDSNMTRMEDRYSVATGSGICPEKCKGEKLSSESKHNLAKVIEL